MNWFICGPSIYKYGKWTFEYGMCSGPWPVRRDGELYQRAGKKFYDDINQFLKMTDEEKRKYKIGGGCERIDLLGVKIK